MLLGLVNLSSVGKLGLEGVKISFRQDRNNVLS